MALAMLALLGFLLMAAGAGLAGIVGSDDTLFSRPAELGQDGRPILTAPGLIAYDDVTVTLRASAPRGVFIGTAHPVDVADFVADSSRIRLTEVNWNGIRTQDIGSSRPVRPASVDFWTDSMKGPDVEELTSDRAAEEAQWVIAPIAGVGPTTVSVGVTVPGLFRGALTAFALGAFGLFVAVELLLRTCRRGSSSHRGKRRAPRSGRPTGPSVLLSMTVLVAVPMSLTGCTWERFVPAQSDVGAELAATKVALTRSELPSLLASYDSRLRSAAKAARAPHYRTTAWRLADRGPALESDLFGTRVAKLTGLGGAVPRPHAPLKVYSPRFSSYPMWTIVASTAGGDDRVDLFTKASVQAPWLRQAGTTVSLNLPEPGRPSRVPNGAAVTATDAATAAWRDYLRAGTDRAGLRIDQDSKDWRENVAGLGSRAMFRGFNVEVDPAGRSGLSRVVAVDDGVLALVALRVTTHLRGRPDLRVEWTSPYGMYRPGQGGVLSFSHLAVGVLHLPAKGPATMLGSTFSEVAVTP